MTISFIYVRPLVSVEELGSQLPWDEFSWKYILVTFH